MRRGMSGKFGDVTVTCQSKRPFVALRLEAILSFSLELEASECVPLQVPAVGRATGKKLI